MTELNCAHGRPFCLALTPVNVSATTLALRTGGARPWFPLVRALLVRAESVSTRNCISIALGDEGQLAGALDNGLVERAERGGQRGSGREV